MTLRRWVPIVFGIAVFLVFVMLGLAVFGIAWVRQHVSIEPAESASAETAFEEVRQRFRGGEPFLEMEGGTIIRRSRPPADAPRASLTAMRVLAWNAREDRLVRVDVPFWLLRLAGPFQLGTYTRGLDGIDVSVTAADLERFGPGIVLDLTRAGDRVLVWVEQAESDRRQAAPRKAP